MPKSRIGYVDLYKDSEKKYRWRICAANARILADSGQGYVRRIDCIRALEAVTATSYWPERQEMTVGTRVFPLSIRDLTK